MYNSAKSYRILSFSWRDYTIITNENIRNTSGYFAILRDTSQYFAILRDTSQYFGILRNTSGYFAILRDTSQYFGIQTVPHHGARCHKIFLASPVRTTRPAFSRAVKSFWIVRTVVVTPKCL